MKKIIFIMTLMVMGLVLTGNKAEAKGRLFNTMYRNTSISKATNRDDLTVRVVITDFNHYRKVKTFKANDKEVEWNLVRWMLFIGNDLSSKHKTTKEMNDHVLYMYAYYDDVLYESVATTATGFLRAFIFNNV